MSNGAPDPLAGLHDIHVPPPVPWWPPAPGWWLVLGLTLALLGLGAWLAWRHWRRGAARRAALARLEEIEAQGREGAAPAWVAAELSVLLRRVALGRRPRAEVAGLTGRRWLEWLDQGLPGRPFSEGVGRALVEAPYRSGTDVDVEALLRLAREWLRAQGPAPGARRQRTLAHA